MLPELDKRVELLRDPEKQWEDSENGHFEGRTLASQAVYCEKYYYTYNGSSDVFCIELTTGERKTLDISFNAPKVICASDELCVYEENAQEIRVFDAETLEEKDPITLPDTAKQVTAMDYTMGTLWIADGNRIFCEEKTKAPWEEVPIVLPDLQGQSISAIRVDVWEDGIKGIAFVTQYVSSSYMEGDEEFVFYENDAYYYNASKQKTNLIIGGSKISEDGPFMPIICSLDVNQGTVYICDNQTVLQYKDGEISWYAMLGEMGETMEGPFQGGIYSWSPTLLRISGNMLLLSFDSPGKVVLYPINRNDALTVLGTPDKLSWMNQYSFLGGAQGFNTIAIEGDQLIDKLTMKLAAGDDDFDIAYVSGDPDDMATLLGSIITYHRYVDLNGLEPFRAVLDEMSPGARGLMEVNDGEICGIPVTAAMSFYGISPRIGETGISTPDPAWTVEEFLDFCEQIKEEGKGYCVFPSAQSMRCSVMMVQMLQGHLQDSDIAPEDAKEEIKDYLNQLEPFVEDGIILGGEPLVISASMGLFGQDSLCENANEVEPILAPVIEEGDRIPLNITGFVFINPNSPNIEEAAQLLSVIFSSEQGYRIEGSDKLPLWPDLSKYRNIYDYGDIYTHAQHYADNSVYYGKLSDLMDQYLERSSLCTLPSSYEANNAMDKFLHGTLSAEEAADIIYKQLVYLQQG